MKRVSLVLLLLASPAYALDLGSAWDWLKRKSDEAAESRVELPKATERAAFSVVGAPEGIVSQSCFQLAGTLPADARTAVVYVRGSRPEVESQFLRHSNQHFTHRLCLKDGPGEYAIRIWTSSQEMRPGQSISMERNWGEILVRNRDVRPFDAFLSPSNDVQSDDSRIQDLARSLAEGKSRELAIGAIHDWVASQVAYDVDGYRAFLAGDELRSYRNKSLDALSILEARVSVCHGYSTLGAALFRAAGIRARVVEGLAISENSRATMAEVLASPQRDGWAHAWLEVELSPGDWRMMDITWNSGYVNADNTRFTPSPKRGIYLQTRGEAASHHLVTRVWDI